MSGWDRSTPLRPDAPAAAHRPARRWLPVWAVVGVLLVTVLGGFVTAAAVPAPEVPAVSVGEVTVHPPPGWAVVRRDLVTLPTTGGTVEAAFVQLSRGSAALDLLATEGLAGDADVGARFYVDEVLRRQLDRLRVSALGHVVLRSGLPAARFAYIGTEPEAGAAVEGQVTVAVSSSGTLAVFDGWASEGQLELSAEEVDEMAHTAEVG